MSKHKQCAGTVKHAKEGYKCGLPADDSGLCWRHDPKRNWSDRARTAETVLRQIVRLCKMVAEDGTPGDYGCGMESTANAVLDILEENNITMEQLKC